MILIAAELDRVQTRLELRNASGLTGQAARFEGAGRDLDALLGEGDIFGARADAMGDAVALAEAEGAGPPDGRERLQPERTTAPHAKITAPKPGPNAVRMELIAERGPLPNAAGSASSHKPRQKLASLVGPAIRCALMTHPLAVELAPIMHRNVEELRAIVAEWVVREASEQERARYRTFGSELRKVKTRIVARPVPPTQEEIEIALTALLALSGRRMLQVQAEPRA